MRDYIPMDNVLNNRLFILHIIIFYGYSKFYIDLFIIMIIFYKRFKKF